MPAFLKKGFRVWGLGFSLIMFIFLYPIPYTLYPTYADWILDLTPPTVTISPSTSTYAADISVPVAISCSDSAGACTFTYTISCNPATPCPPGGSGTNISPASFSVSGSSQTITISATATDTAGNITLSSSNITFNTRADLIVSSVTISPSLPVTGNVLSFTGVVRNQGGSTSPISTTRFSLDIGNNGTDDLLADFATNALAVSATETKNWINAWSATTGTHKLEVCVDIANVVSESNESNNCAPIIFDVYPPLTVSCIGSPPNALVNETRVVWSTSPSGGTETYFYSWSGTAVTDPGTIQSGSTTSSTFGKTYSTVGTKTGTVSVTSGSQTQSCTASVLVGYPPFIQTTGGDVHEQE